MDIGIERFLAAQEGIHRVACDELRAGLKTGHWIWFVFPQLSGLGRSDSARFYGIRGIKEARLYMNHPLLGRRLSEAIEALLEGATKRDAVSVDEILGSLDAMKVRSCLTLFGEACSGFESASSELRSIIDRAMSELYPGGRDALTLELLGRN